MILKFLNELEKELSIINKVFTVVVVDDGSTDSTLEKLQGYVFKSGNCKLEIVLMEYNSGHQAAIARGLEYAAGIEASGYIVMDCDGEDDIKAISQLVGMNDFEIVFISRGKRKVGLGFRLGYAIYKLLFKMISGNAIDFGNYSMINRNVLNVVRQNGFQHYSAFLSKLKYKKEFLKYDRKKRHDGRSKMNYNNLVQHGVKSMVEYAEELLNFFIRILFFIIFVFILYGGYIVYSKFISQDAIPGWASSVTIGLINSMLITSGIIVLGVLILSRKNQ